MMPVVCSFYALHPEEVAGKKSICTNAEKMCCISTEETLNHYASGVHRGGTILSYGAQIGRQSKLKNT